MCLKSKCTGLLLYSKPVNQITFIFSKISKSKVLRINENKSTTGNHKSENDKKPCFRSLCRLWTSTLTLNLVYTLFRYNLVLAIFKSLRVVFRS